MTSPPTTKPRATTLPTAGLPVADSRRVRRAAFGLIGADRRAFAVILLLNSAAAGAGLVSPWLLGVIINDVQKHRPIGIVDRLALVILLAAIAQIILSRYAFNVGNRFGERTAARIREQFLDRVLALPSTVVEHVATGDLAARGTSDITTVANTLRDAIPDVFIATAQCAFILGAVFVLDPLLGACGIVCLTSLWFVARWYLRRARTAYLAEGAANSALAEVLTATAHGARTIEALGLQLRRITAADEAIAECRRTRMRTLFLRSVLFPGVDVSYVLPVVGVLLVGGALYDHGLMSTGAIVASALYLRQLAFPLDAILMWMEQLQSSSASFARIEGLALYPPATPALTPAST
jgi:ATP-binding cassette, subfamily C, bacterial